jgi:4-amino-4-deoxy-L-arabinose transferase-like glycosyltransferase
VSRRKEFTGALAVTAVSALVFFLSLGRKPLAPWDEGIYAEVSREMLHGSWFAPMWNFRPWMEKPPLELWLTASLFHLFAVNAFWARAASAMAAVAVVVICWLWLNRHRSHTGAWLGAAMLLLTPGFVRAGRLGEMDSLLSLGLVAAIYGLTLVEKEKLSTGWLLFWLGAAIASMTKGPAAIALALTLAIALACMQSIRRAIFTRYFFMGLAVFLVLVLPWHLAMEAHFSKAFIAEYLGFHTLTRATHQIEGHVSHWWYYGWVLLLMAAPWVLLYPVALVRGFRDNRLKLWAIFASVVVVFFSVVQTRLSHYVVPAYPAFCILTADLLAAFLASSANRRKTWSFAAVALLLCVASSKITAKARAQLHAGREITATAGPIPLSAFTAEIRKLPSDEPLLLNGVADPIMPQIWLFNTGRKTIQVREKDMILPYASRYADPIPLCEAVGESQSIMVADHEEIQSPNCSLQIVPLAQQNGWLLATVSRE